MAPIRRYLRISKYSVLECRVFVEDPADTQRWLLNPGDPVLPRVFESVKPLILPKLREENDRAKGKGRKRKTVKDVVTEDDFEVSIFLREIGTRHSLLTKSKTFRQKGKITSNSGKMTGEWDLPVIVRDESDDEAVNLEEIPSARPSTAAGNRSRSREPGDDDVSDASDVDEEDAPDEKKKLGLKTSYEGFSIWGWVLCLIVKRKGHLAKQNSLQSADTGQALMEEWIASTQAQAEDD